MEHPVTTERISVDVHLPPGGPLSGMAADVRAGLTRPFKELSPRYFYDERGSELFDDITRLAEYYPTRCEREILERQAGEIAVTSGADTLVELGCFIPFDCSEATLCSASESISAAYAGVDVQAVVGDFERHLGRLPRRDHGHRLVAFLGGTIGNLELAGGLGQGEHLLLGTDLVKDRDRLVNAYDDAAGVTAEFNRNVLHVINRAL